jgi:hypothetical protein
VSVRWEGLVFLNINRTGYLVDVSSVRRGVRVFGHITPLLMSRGCVFGLNRTPNTSSVSICAYSKSAEQPPNTVRKLFGRTGKANAYPVRSTSDSTRRPH